MRIRPERVAQQMRREIAALLEHKMRDPRLGTMISVTDVEVTNDLSASWGTRSACARCRS